MKRYKIAVALVGVCCEEAKGSQDQNADTEDEEVGPK